MWFALPSAIVGLLTFIIQLIGSNQLQLVLWIIDEMPIYPSEATDG